jgi:predicted dehydrogenase
VRVDELDEHGEAVSKEILSSLQDAYTTELEELYKCLVEGKPIKTSAEDALNDLRLFDMMYKKYDQDHRND